MGVEKTLKKEKMMSDYLTALDKEDWSAHYNMKSLDNIVKEISTGNVSVWSKELLKICAGGGKTTCLEIGCGTGASSLWLAKNGRDVTALDYTESSIALVKKAAELLKLNNVHTVLCDATKDLPFYDRQFDYIFQAGLLEHFETEEQIRLLGRWKKYGKYMISMIPSAASIPYRVGKDIMEKSKTWEYGLEIPKHSFSEEFTRAGIAVEREYTIGSKWAQRFLPKRHYVRRFFTRLERDGYHLDELMQGYLLVTIGRCVEDKKAEQNKCKENNTGEQNP